MPYDGKCLIDSLGHILNKLLKDQIWRVLHPQGKHCCTKSMVEEAEKSHQHFKQQRKQTKTAKLERTFYKFQFMRVSKNDLVQKLMEALLL